MNIDDLTVEELRERLLEAESNLQAIYSGGVFMPTRKLGLQDKQRVRLTVERIDEPERDRASGRERGAVPSGAAAG